MDIKKIMVICVIAVSMYTISAVSVVCAEADSQNPASASQAGTTPYLGMPKEDLFKIYHRGDICKFEKRGNEEVFVFDDILTHIPDDTITFYLVDGKVKSWDKNRVIFPADEGLRSAIYPGITKEGLLRIYNIGNLKAYSRTGNKEIGTFYDILSSDPDDTVTFYLVDGKVKSWNRSKAISLTSEELHKIFPVEKRKAYAKSGYTEAETYYNTLTADPNDTITIYLFDGRVQSWEMNTEASLADVKLIDEMMTAAMAKVKSDSDKAKAEADRAKAESYARFKAEAEADKAKAEADFKEILSRAKSDTDARMRAMEERARFNNYSAGQPTQEDDIISAKQQRRASSVRSHGWHYSGGLYY